MTSISLVFLTANVLDMYGNVMIRQVIFYRSTSSFYFQILQKGFYGVQDS